ncbi:hypothetical protein ILUMI_02119 [Ignelater luminosus]|uniref:Reverse transcriptase Ty1/copia-type domain-containing protein n=1 Tax=Ignelater luminosus TaxID=2038154 RepID=A0A8K0DH12_IGNLU|nr:hypothetical protein ILUMI_02119 [Ignelater luminosus]
MNVTTAFLHPKLPEEIYVKLPGSQIRRLLKSMYGLKPASHVWYLELDTVLRRLNFTSTLNDTCVYIRFQTGVLLLVGIYVGDILIFSNNDKSKSWLRVKLMKTFSMKDLGSLNPCPGIQVTRQDRSIILNQESYLRHALQI